MQTKSIVSEPLRDIRADTARISDAMRTMQAEMTSLRQHVTGLVTLQEHDQAA